MSLSSGDEDEDEQMEVILEFDADQMFMAEPAIAGPHGQDSPSNHSFLTGATSGIVAQSVHSNRSRGSATTNATEASLQRQTEVNHDNG